MVVINKINYKLVNFTLITIIIFFIMITKDVWINLYNILKQALSPVIIAFVLAYVFNSLIPLINFNGGNTLKKVIVLIIFFLVLISIRILAFPLLIKNGIELINYLIPLLKDIIKIESINSYLVGILNKILSILTNNGITLIKSSLNTFSNIILIIILSIYFLFNMESIKKFILKIVYKKQTVYNILKNIDYKLTSYLKSIFIITLIEMIEYTLIYFFIGHPYYLLIGYLAGITTFIPMFGAILTNIIALITGIYVSKKLFILSALVIILCPIIDSYLIDPKIYNKNIKISQIKILIAIIISSSLFNILGIIIAVPLCIIFDEIIKELWRIYFTKK